MTHEEIISQLESLREHCKSMIHDDEPDDIWRDDVEALGFAIVESKRGAARAFCYKHPACCVCPLYRFGGCGGIEYEDEAGLDAILREIREVSGA